MSIFRRLWPRPDPGPFTRPPLVDRVTRLDTALAKIAEEEFHGKVKQVYFGHPMLGVQSRILFGFNGEWLAELREDTDGSFFRVRLESHEG